MGNADNLTDINDIKTWQKVFEVFELIKYTGFSLPLTYEGSIPTQSRPNRNAVKDGTKFM